MKLPDAVEVTPELAVEMARRNGLRAGVARPMPSQGMINTVIALDDRFVLKVPRDHPAHVDQAHTEAQAVPLAVAAGVRTPRLVAYDTSLDLVPVPFLIVEQVDGQDIESSRVDLTTIDAVWVEVGRDLARLHQSVPLDAWPSKSGPPTDVPGEELLGQRVNDGWFTYAEAAWIGPWLKRLDDRCGAGAATRATHSDPQMSNIIISAGGQYQALIDWGCASIDDPVVDFRPMPLAAVPALLRGYRQIAPLPDDENAEARILRSRIRTLLWLLPRGATPDMAWGERPVSWLADLLRFFQAPPDDKWRDLGP